MSMNFYYYWFYIVHGFYYSFSRDFHFDILAVGLFSIIVSFLIFGVTALIIITIGIQNILFSNPIPIVSGAVGIHLINSIIFLPKKRQMRLMTKFKQNQSITNDIIAIVLTSLSIITFILATILNAKTK
jgi:hypothetical protein